MNTIKKLDFSKNYILENERVKLRPLLLQDIDALEHVANEAEIWTYFLENGLGKNYKKYILTAINQRDQGKEYPFLVLDKRNNQLAGLTRLYDYIPNLQSIKIGHTWYGTAFQGTGINKNCKFLLFEFAFEQLGMERIGFGVHGENLRSIAALKSVGCTQEGVLRNFLHQTRGEARVDLLHFSILRNEWLTSVKEALTTKLRY